MKEAEQAQMHKDSWLDIANHAAGQEFPGNAIGGFAFEWLDNWWQSWNEWQQDLKDDGWHHEFNGIFSQGNGHHSPLLRDVREVYYMYQRLWNKTSSDGGGAV